MLGGCHEEPEQNIYEGMSFEEFMAKNSEESYFAYIGYLFTKDNEGNHVVARLSDDCTVITKVTRYEAKSIDNSDESFVKIKEGMSVEQIVSMVGIPEDSYTSGMISLGFQSDTGARYSIYLNQVRDEESTALYVSSIKLLDKIVISNKGITVQVEIGMSSKEVYDLLRSTTDIESGTLIEEYKLSEGGIVHLGYAEDAEGTLRVEDIDIENPGR
jgi:hypothetical protein